MKRRKSRKGSIPGSWIVAGLLCLLFFSPGCSHKEPEMQEQTALPAASTPSLPNAHGEDTENWPGSFGFGRPANAAEIAALDIDIRPDGSGLPPGSGDAIKGRVLYGQKCAACHGLTGTEGPNDVLVGPAVAEALPFGLDLSRKKTIGNYWPYAPTVFDYIRRAMPFNAPGSLSNEEVYSITAFLLHANSIIDSTEVMDARSLPAVVMPANKLFVVDDRQGGAEIR